MFGKRLRRTVRSTRSRTIQLIIAILSIAGPVVATGLILNTITRTQTVTGVVLFLDANCDGINGGNEAFASVSMGQPVSFCLAVGNTATSDLLVHTHLSVVCPAGGVAAISDGPGVGDDLQGPDAVDTCLTPVAGVSKTVVGAGSASWSYTVVYSVAAGDFLWTFTVAQG